MRYINRLFTYFLLTEARPDDKVKNEKRRSLSEVSARGTVDT